MNHASFFCFRDSQCPTAERQTLSASSPPATMRSWRPPARQDAILAAACDAAAEGGMAAVQIAPVAARAGIATGTVYRYFPSKTELVAALVAALCAREVAALEGAAQAAPGPLSALAAA